MMKVPKQYAVVVFDGECSFCNGWIDFPLRFDKKEAFRFTARQSESGASFASESGLPPGTGYFFYSDNTGLPDAYNDEEIKTKAENVFQHVFYADRTGRDRVRGPRQRSHHLDEALDGCDSSQTDAGENLRSPAMKGTHPHRSPRPRESCKMSGVYSP
jgi:hypothetical protein